MALSVLPVEGLIHRLIQQQQLPATKASSATSDQKKHDQVNISNQARERADTGASEQTPSKLENQLLQMYSARSVSGS
ncbi:MAG: hypothetical protein Q9M25_09685 [Mariprofundaceae bacterium]|nr:hypothetical protein [Mariprofundaceae bacterium]